MSVQIPYRCVEGPLTLLVDSSGIKFLGDCALSAECFAIARRMRNGRPGNVARSDPANGARFLWPWIRRPPTSERWHSPSAGTAAPMICKHLTAAQGMRCLSSFGERSGARDSDQTAEIRIRIALMNRFKALVTAEVVRVA
ncbi:hypothetical protein NBRC116599_36860 [Aquicoccus sp. SU-CL01552]